MNTTKTPKTWNELLEAGYVVELNECQIAEAREKLNPSLVKPLLSKEEQAAHNDLLERKMRGI